MKDQRTKVRDRISFVHDAIHLWLDGLGKPGSPLQAAIDNTLANNYFRESDVIHAINHTRKQVSSATLTTWCQMAGLFKDENLSKTAGIPNSDAPSVDKTISAKRVTETTVQQKTVLCLHAGNLPLVGLQDLLAVILSGRNYLGKVSRKDPWLLPSLVQVMNEADPPCQLVTNTDILAFSGAQTETWTFSGSDQRLESLISLLHQHNIITPNARSLQRTAHFSVYVQRELDTSQLSAIIEGMFRYGGTGCRSIAAVYTDTPLLAVAADLKDEADKWFENNRPEDQNSPTQHPIIAYRHAYNKATGTQSTQLGTHLIQESQFQPDYPQIIYWNKWQSAGDIRQAFGGALQEVYGPASSNQSPVQEAQAPPLYWTPDRVDILKWLTHN